MKVHRSALKHGISSEDATQAAEWSLWIEPLDEDGPSHRELRLGFDTGARLEEDTYCIDVLQQIAAVNGALQNVAIGLLDEHVGHCVANAAAPATRTRPATWSPKPPSHRQDHQDLTPAPPTASATREERP